VVLLYDGLCGFCNGTVRFILARDRAGTMQFAALQGDFAKGVLSRRPEVQGADSLILVEHEGTRGEVVSVRSEAVLRVASYLGAGWRFVVVVRVLPRVLRDALYDAFARFRYRLFGRYDACPVPEPSVRERFR